jgi:dinuclear metal center YbgI/SA1388 family protein
MKCSDIFKYISSWAPEEIAWNKDNVGLQIGSAERELKNILLALDLNMKVVEEAVKNNCNLIITHHPLLFNPLRKINTDNDITSRLIEKLIKKNITLFAAHTNLDFTRDGVSFKLAEALGLKNISFLKNLEANQVKLIVFVPENHIEQIAQSIFENGGGIIGNYSHCSFRMNGTGTFMGSEKSNPAIGKKQNYEKVSEVKLEVLVDSWKLDKMLTSIKTSHPYEEMAYDIYPLKNKNVNYGIGAIGKLPGEMSADAFLKYVSEKININNFRYTEGKSNKIKKVAVCGGSGSEFINEALIKKADAYITADVKYHSFFDSQKKILLIDAGHYETEAFSLKEIKKRLSDFTKSKRSIKVYEFSGLTNPVIFYNN